MFKRNKLHISIHKYIQSLAVGAATVALIPGFAIAEQGDSAEDKKVLEEIIVTGTLIRGSDAVGTQAIGIDREAITDSGAVTTNELLATVPQITNSFNARAEQDPRGAFNNTVNRPNLRNLPGFTGASGSTTLVLVDGHRLAPLGVNESSLDPDMIAGGVIERVEIITDGGSSLYGSDAVGGVINFVTKKQVDGVQVDLGLGAGDDYSSWDTTVTAGTNWENGTGYISLSKSERDNVRNSDRDWAAAGDWINGELIPDGTECLSPVGAITTWGHFGGGWTSNPRATSLGVKVTPIGEPCDIKGGASLLPEQERDNLFLRVTQELASNITFDVTAYFGERTTTFSSYPLGDTISEPDPNTLGVPGVLFDTYDVAEVGFSYGSHPAYRHREQEISLQSWGITPELIIDLESGWQLRNTLYYGRSNSTIVQPGSNFLALAGYVDTQQLDPSNVAAADAAVIDDILNWEYAGSTIQELVSLRMIADGEVMDLPAGKMRTAVGFQVSQDRARKRDGDGTVGSLFGVDYEEDSRDVKSFFAELSIPVVTNLDLSLSVRTDDYSDFGKTTNPNIGITYTPLDWLKVYGHWGESFNAPTVLDRLGTALGRTTPGASTVPDPLDELNPGDPDGVFQLIGAKGALEPQIAESWAFGFEIQPPGAQGLTLSANYYEIDFSQILGAPDPQIASAVLLNPEKFIFNPTQEEYDAFLAAVENADAVQAFFPNGIADIGLILDRRIDNTDAATLRGVDFNINYVRDTDIGSLLFGLAGNHQLELESIQNGTSVDTLEFNVSDLSMVGTLGWSRDNVRAKLTLKYTDGFDVDGAEVGQTSVDSYLVTDLFVGYEFDESLSLRFNVDNVFDEDPPIWRRNAVLNYSGFTLGRVFKLNVSKKF